MWLLKILLVNNFTLMFCSFKRLILSVRLQNKNTNIIYCHGSTDGSIVSLVARIETMDSHELSMFDLDAHATEVDSKPHNKNNCLGEKLRTVCCK